MLVGAKVFLQKVKAVPYEAKYLPTSNLKLFWRVKGDLLSFQYSSQISEKQYTENCIASVSGRWFMVGKKSVDANFSVPWLV